MFGKTHIKKIETNGCEKNRLGRVYTKHIFS
jgi:hypothetical protein